MRHTTLAFLCLLATASHAAAPELSCSVGNETYESREMLCAIPPAARPQRLQFIARFSGGHDDTRASIVTELDDQPLACDTGSKKELFGEDGEVSLNCGFAVPAGAKGDARFKVTIRWSHAQYTDARLSRQD